METTERQVIIDIDSLREALAEAGDRGAGGHLRLYVPEAARAGVLVQPYTSTASYIATEMHVKAWRTE